MLTRLFKDARSSCFGPMHASHAARGARFMTYFLQRRLAMHTHVNGERGTVRSMGCELAAKRRESSRHVVRSIRGTL